MIKAAAETDRQRSQRASANDRAARYSPFLRAAIAAFPAIAGNFERSGSASAIAEALAQSADSVGAALRRQRHALALAVALGDLAGELSLEAVTAHLSAFADHAIDAALTAAISERAPDEEPRGVAVIALGKLGSGESF